MQRKVLKDQPARGTLKRMLKILFIFMGAFWSASSVIPHGYAQAAVSFDQTPKVSRVFLSQKGGQGCRRALRPGDKLLSCQRTSKGWTAKILRNGRVIRVEVKGR